jgi:arabinofuranosyltransferase
LSSIVQNFRLRPVRRDTEDGFPESRRPALRWPLVLTIAVLTIAYGYEVWQRRWLSDDGMIATRTIRQLLAGNGPVFNVGERAESNTSTLWTYLLAAVTAMTGARDPGYVSVLVGFVLSAAGLAVGMTGTAVWFRRRGVTRFLVPAGALVVLALPPFWDFGTSGLETPLVFCWLGACWYLLCRITPGSRLPQLCLAAFVFGLGWLVRPDLALVTVIFLPALWFRVRPSLRRTFGLLCVAAALPVGYEIFRAGYYGIVVPMPAISKNAASTDWDRGIAYLRDFAGPYHLYVAVLLLIAAAIIVALRWVHLDRDFVVPLSAAVVAGLAMIGYVTAIGGDFMHGRMLLPGVFLLLLPVSLMPWSKLVGVLCCALGAWTVLSAASWRPAYSSYEPKGIAGIADERQFYVNTTGVRNPDSTADYFGGALPAGWTDTGQAAPTLTLNLGPSQSTLQLGPINTAQGRQAIVVLAGLGDAGSRASLTGVALDDIGLSYPLAAHAELDHRGQPGHEKNLPLVWVAADLADPNWPGYPGMVDTAALAAARHALTCGGLGQLQHAVRDPMTTGRFLQNLGEALSNSTVVVPADPFVAERQLCHSPG